MVELPEAVRSDQHNSTAAQRHNQTFDPCLEADILCAGQDD